MRTFLLSLTCLWTFTAAAQTAPAAEPAPAAAPAPAPAVVAPAPAAAPVAAVEAAKAEAADPLKDVLKRLDAFNKLVGLRVYGLIKPTIIASGSAVESYSQPNMTALTAAGNPAVAYNADLGRLTFQAGQSRLGFHIGEGTPYHAQIETDFLDFTKASPTVASVPRIRIAKLDWKPADNITITAGQDWDLVQPVNPHGMDWVGALFQAGNSSYMRQQVKVLYTAGPAEVGIAAGMRTNTNGASDTALEIGLTPTVAMRAQYNMGKAGKVGISGIATAILYKGTASAPDSRAFAGLAGIYGDVTLAGVNFRAEGYAGQNAANLYLLTLGQGRAGTGNTPIDMRELGGFLSIKVPISIVSIYGMFGGASVLNDADVVPSYSYPTATPTTATLNTANGPGIKFNISSRLGLDVQIFKKDALALNFLFEGYYFRTKHALVAADFAKVSVPSAFGIETGFQMTF